ncbi:MAG: hypothetical protein RXO24_07445 [Acidilobus sp.]
MSSSRSEGASGLHYSLPLMSFTSFQYSGLVGSATIDLLPRALGPSSALP